MTWEPIDLTHLESMVSDDLLDCSEEQRKLFARVRISPLKWELSPWGDEGGGFWAVAVPLDRVLWYNDIEDGFNVSRFEVPGEIPQGEYWCNQDSLRWALPRLVSDDGQRSGPPRPMTTETHVYLGVFDFGDDPGVVSAIMGIEPTSAWVKGEPYSPSFPDARRTHSRWVLGSGLDKVEPLEKHLDAILAKLEPMRAEIGQIAKRFTVRVNVAQYFHEINPGFRLEAGVLQRFAQLGLAIDFDQYCPGQDEAG